jgi:glycosyltransferase involved in cell wall biosynthesis
MYNFNSVALLITHYNRSNSLDRLLRSLKKLNIYFGEIIVSDDCSSSEHLGYLKNIQEEFKFQLITTLENKGLGNNINKGQAAVSLPYTLYIQEDFTPKTEFVDALSNALKFLEREPQIDIVRFYAYGLFPHLKPYGKGFAEMQFSLKLKGYGKFYMYSDHPHLRHTGFPKKFGKYAENFSGDQIEYRMMMSFLQKKGKGLFYVNHKDLFDDDNLETEQSTMERNYWRNSSNPLISGLRFFYRHLKFNFNYIFNKYNY